VATAPLMPAHDSAVSTGAACAPGAAASGSPVLPVAEAVAAINTVASAVKRTNAEAVLRQSGALTSRLQGLRPRVRDARAAIRRGVLRRLSSGRGRQQPVPWLWYATPGVSATFQAGVAAALPIDARGVWRTWSQVGATAPRGSASGGAAAAAPGANGTGCDDGARPSVVASILAPIAPLVRGAHLQPLLRARAEAVAGRFRGWAFDHTAVILDAELAVRHGVRRHLWPLGAPPGRPRASVAHRVTLGARQQLVGPVRLCADVRWELATDGGPAGEARLQPRVAPGVSFLSGAACHLRNLAPYRTDAVVGADVCLGAGRVAAWVSLSKRQGLIELRI
jgi:hypothetical protein